MAESDVSYLPASLTHLFSSIWFYIHAYKKEKKEEEEEEYEGGDSETELVET